MDNAGKGAAPAAGAASLSNEVSGAESSPKFRSAAAIKEHARMYGVVKRRLKREYNRARRGDGTHWMARGTAQELRANYKEAQRRLVEMMVMTDAEWHDLHKLSDEDKALLETLGDDCLCQGNRWCGRPITHQGEHDNFGLKEGWCAADEEEDFDIEELLPWGATKTAPVAAPAPKRTVQRTFRCSCASCKATLQFKVTCSTTSATAVKTKCASCSTELRINIPPIPLEQSAARV